MCVVNALREKMLILERIGNLAHICRHYITILVVEDYLLAVQPVTNLIIQDC